MERIEQTLKEISKQGQVPKEILNEVGKIKDLDTQIESKLYELCSYEKLSRHAVQEIFPQIKVATIPAAETKQLKAQLAETDARA